MHDVAPLLDQLALDTEVALGRGRGHMRHLITQIAEARRANGAEGATNPVYDFMQFYVASGALASAMQAGELNEAADWIMWSLTDRIEDGQVQELQIGRLAGIALTPVLQNWPRTRACITRWLTNFYYYARLRAAMRNIGQGIWPFARGWVEAMTRVGVSPAAADLAGMLLSWAAQESEEHAREFTSQVEVWATSDEVHPRAKAMLTLTLATRAGRFSSIPNFQWAHWGLDRLRNRMVPHERLQLLLALLDHEYDPDVFHQAMLEVDDIPPRDEDQNRLTVDFLRRFDRMPDLGSALSTTPLRRGDVAGVIEALARWYGKASKPLLKGDQTIVFAPFWSAGFHALEGGRTLSAAVDTQAALESVVQTANLFGNTSTSVTGAQDTVLHVPENEQAFGVPNEARAAAYEQALSHAYCPPQLRDQIRALSSERFQVILGAKPHPVQAIQLRCLGKTWPVSASLQLPAADRPPRRLVAWSGAGSLSEAYELQTLRTIFERAGCLVEVHEPETTTVEDFLRVYKDPSVDVFWVVSHGEYDHWSPKNVAVQIGRSASFIRLDDLLNELPPMEGRRLLVLNVCDGGRFEELGTLPRIGFAAALAGRHQAVISQLWPVKGWPAAAFGALLAGHLANGAPYFAGYAAALSEVRCTREALANRVCGAAGQWVELCDRISNSGEDFENFAATGSPVFYQ